MLSQSVSGSSLLSGYDDGDLQSNNGRTRPSFDEIDAFLYDEQKPKRSSMKKICDEWSSKPKLRIRGLFYPNVSVQDEKNSKIVEFEEKQKKSSDFFFDEIVSGRSSINSIEGSEQINDLDSDSIDDGTETIRSTIEHNFVGAPGDSFDTDDSEDGEPTGELCHVKKPKISVQCLKDNIVNNLALLIFRTFTDEQNTKIEEYARLVLHQNSKKISRKTRPNSLPARPISRNRSLLNTTTSNISMNNNLLFHPLSNSPSRELSDILHVTGLSHPQNRPLSARKSQLTTSLPVEKTADRRQSEQLSITLIGTAVGNSLNNFPSKSSQSSVRHGSTLPHRSATTISTSSTRTEAPTRLPPIPDENGSISARSNVFSLSSTDLVPNSNKFFSGKNRSNLFPLNSVDLVSNPNKTPSGKTRPNNGLTRISRISSRNVSNSSSFNKDFSNSLSTSYKPPATPTFQPVISSRRVLLTNKSSTPNSTRIQ